MASASSASTTVPMTGPQSVTANFQLLTTTTVAAVSGQNGAPVTLSATVGPTGAVFSGSLQFQVQGTNVGSPVAVNGSGTYTTGYTITQIPGSYTISAILTSTTPLAVGSSGTGTLTVNQPAVNFTIKAVPPTQTAYRGVLAGFLLELKSVNGFNANVSLSCTGGPAGSKCANLPQTVKVNGTAHALSGILFPKNSTPGTYTITFTGVSGSVTNSTTATFTVK